MVISIENRKIFHPPTCILRQECCSKIISLFAWRKNRDKYVKWHTKIAVVCLSVCLSLFICLLISYGLYVCMYVREVATICPPASWPLTFWPWKWCLSHGVTWATSVPLLFSLPSLSVLDLGPKYATDVRQTDVWRASSLNAPTLGAGA